MRSRYFAETDTLHIEFRDVPAAETRDLDESTLLDIDAGKSAVGQNQTDAEIRTRES